MDVTVIELPSHRGNVSEHIAWEVTVEWLTSVLLAHCSVYHLETKTRDSELRRRLNASLY